MLKVKTLEITTTYNCWHLPQFILLNKYHQPTKSKKLKFGYRSVRYARSGRTAIQEKRKYLNKTFYLSEMLKFGYRSVGCVRNAFPEQLKWIGIWIWLIILSKYFHIDIPLRLSLLNLFWGIKTSLGYETHNLVT